MSQNEMVLKHMKKVMAIASACLIALAPSISSAAISKSYFPAYCYVVKTADSSPVGQVALKLSEISKISRAPAAINRAALTVSAPSKVFYGDNGQELSPELIMSFNQIRATEKPINISEHIPMDMKPSNNSMEVFSQVADRSLTAFFNSQAVRESSIGQTATYVETKMKQEVVLGGSEDDPKAVQHKLNFNVQAFQATAQVQYTGLTNAALKYKIAENKMALEVFEKVADDQDFVVSHTVSRADQQSQVSYRWSF